MSETMVDVNDVSIMFRLYRENVDNLKEFMIKKIKRQISYDEFWALSNVDFHVQRGEAVALVGKNGSGKSTFVKNNCRCFKTDKRFRRD